MSASKNRATSTILRSEHKSFFRFFVLYLLLVSLLLGIAGYYYYKSQEKLAYSVYRIKLMKYAVDQIKRLHTLHDHFPQDNIYPRDGRFDSAIYDLEYTKIFSTLHEPSVDIEEEIYKIGHKIHFVKILDNYYLGAKYLVIEVPEDTEWSSMAMHTIWLYGSVALMVLLGIGLYLTKLFVRPMHNSILLLDQFIKDTTHELNTPLSAILANIETIDTEGMKESNIKRLKRINIAARTVSTLYEDLKFVTLESDKETTDEMLDMRDLVESRLEYFEILMHSKRLTLHKDISISTLRADRRLIERIVDNLISNAIKYNRRGSEIYIRLSQGRLEIEDSGIGISADHLLMIFDRYRRFNDSEGGFGIGLSIVRRIADHYGISIDVSSKEGKWTKVVLRW